MRKRNKIEFVRVFVCSYLFDSIAKYFNCEYVMNKSVLLLNSLYKISIFYVAAVVVVVVVAVTVVIVVVVV